MKWIISKVKLFACGLNLHKPDREIWNVSTRRRCSINRSHSHSQSHNRRSQMAANIGANLADAEQKQMDAVLQFWFAPAHRALWFRSTPEFDAAIRAQFLALHERAAGGECDAWADAGAVSAVALCVLLDQFPRNMFRGTARAFATDAKGEQVARRALERGFDAALSDGSALSAYRLAQGAAAESGGGGETLDGSKMLHFLLMPLMHSERLETQELSVQKFAATGQQTHAFAALHRDVIKRFGRFPGRNKALGRESTAEELAWLDSPEGKHF